MRWLFDGLTPYELCCTSRDAFTPVDRDGVALPPELEAKRLALAELYVLTLGQGVPAIYFNDLLGIGNDFDGYKASGRPRDLNRKKVPLSDSGLTGEMDRFTEAYLPLIRRYTELRAAERAFYPGSDRFEFTPLSDVVFLNHAYARGEHAYVIGNITGVTQRFSLETGGGVVDLISGGTLVPENGATISGELEPFGALWLKPHSQ
jgi:hypothetical protein